MSLQVIKLGLVLVCFLHFGPSSNTRQLSSPISLTHAFLYHKIQPSSPAYKNIYENSSSSYLSADNNSRQNRFLVRSTNLNAESSTRQQAYTSHLTRDTLIDYQDLGDKLIDCPTECECNTTTLIADCSNKNLERVPTVFPKDIKRISLQRNNITELGPHSFQGLKRLQRIDLSNNNLLKIDPLAFAGGLQSLNSLILYSNKLSQLPVNLFSELSQLQLLLLNDNSLQCIHKELFRSLENLNLLSLYDNNIETLSNGTFDGLKSIKTIHLGKNPLVCDCNLRWLADYLEARPTIETSEARCDGKNQPPRSYGKRLNQVNKQKFKCEGNDQGKINQCSIQPQDQSCPPGCNCSGSTVDCSRTSSQQSTESRVGEPIYALPDVPDDVPVYVTKMRINDQRIKRIRQTGLFRRLANSQKLGLGNNKIIDIEDNAINSGSNVAGGPTPKPERVVFVLVENDHCDSGTTTNKLLHEDGCSLAPKVNPPNFDSPCYNGGSCMSTSVGTRSAAPFSSNYSCLCPPGFSGPLCEINIDDCIEHQCQNGALCVDGVNSYKCICRDPSTTGEFCEQLNSYSTNSANPMAPIALPMIAHGNQNIVSEQPIAPQQPQLLTRSADLSQPPVDLFRGGSENECRRVIQRKYYDDGNGCQSVRVLKLSECTANPSSNTSGCCQVAKMKRRRVRMQCSDGASYVKTIDLVKKCVWSSGCNQRVI